MEGTVDLWEVIEVYGWSGFASLINNKGFILVEAVFEIDVDIEPKLLCVDVS